MSNSYYRVEEPNIKLINKFESCEEIRPLIDSILENDEVKRSLRKMSERLVSLVRDGSKLGIFTEEDLKVLASEEKWILGYKAQLYDSWLKTAAEEMIKEGKTWNVKSRLKSLIKDNSVEFIIETIQIFSYKASETIREIINHEIQN